MKKKISILLPYKDQFTNKFAGSASIWIKDFLKLSNLKEKTTIFGYTRNLNDVIIKKKYINLKFNELTFESKNKKYVDAFISHISEEKFDLIEIHNRPSYLKQIDSKIQDLNFMLIFHNNPLTLKGSKKINERIGLIKKCKKIIFVSNWVKEKFFDGLDVKNHEKCEVIYPSINQIKHLPPKKKIIIFVGKLNYSKGYHLFGNVIIKILKKYPKWRAYIIGDEPREKYSFFHKRFQLLGWLNHTLTLKKYEESSIAVTPSFWEEPFGRTAMESASRGCATIMSKKGGLTETTPHALFLNKLTVKELFSKIEYLIKNKSVRKQLQIKSYKNIYHDIKVNTKKIDVIKNNILINKKFFVSNKKQIKIVHISNFGSRLFNRIYHISIAKKLSNGFIRLGHDVINISDRDIIRQNRTIKDISGKDSLNLNIVETVKNYKPDLILLGHSFDINKSTFEKISSHNKNIKIIQWYEDHLANSGPDFTSNRDKFFKYSEFIDHNFITTHPSALNFIDKNKSHYLPIPVDPNIEKLKIYENKYIKNDLFFTMSHGVNRGTLKKNKIDERTSFVEKLINKCPNIIFDIYGFNNREPVWGEDFYKSINNSKMGLNLSRGKPLRYLTSNRIASLVGNGLLTFVDEKTQLNDFFNDNELIFYKNVDDLSNKILYFKNNDNKRIQFAKKGREKYFLLFESQNICNYMLSIIFDMKIKQKLKWMDS